MHAASKITRYVLLYALIVLCTVLLWRRPYLLAGVYLALSAALLALWRSRQERAMYALAFVLGPLGEIAAVGRGVWSYALVDSMIPVWLPFAWGTTALFLLRMVRTIGPE